MNYDQETQIKEVKEILAEIETESEKIKERQRILDLTKKAIIQSVEETQSRNV